MTMACSLDSAGWDASHVLLSALARLVVDPPHDGTVNRNPFSLTISYTRLMCIFRSTGIWLAVLPASAMVISQVMSLSFGGVVAAGQGCPRRERLPCKRFRLDAGADRAVGNFHARSSSGGMLR